MPRRIFGHTVGMMCCDPRRIVVCIVVILTMVWSVVLHAQPGQGPIPVAVVKAQTSVWPRTLTAVGSLRAEQEVVVSSEVPGRVIAIRFESGQTVERGDVLVELDAAADRAQLADLEAQRNLARLELRRIDRLVAEKSLSEADKDVATSTLAQLQARIAAQQDVILKKKLAAPFAGKLGLRRVNLGQVLSPGDDIVSLQSYQPLLVDFPVPQNALANLTPGLPLALRTDAYPDRVFEAKVAALDARVDGTTRAITVRGTTDNGDEALRPGMFVTVELTLDESREFVTVPSAALIYSTLGANVFVVENGAGDNNLTARRIAVETADRRGDLVAISSGLSAGDRVVAAGQVRLRDGAAIRIDETAPIFDQRDVTNVRD